MRKPANRIAKTTAKQTVFFFTFIPSFPHTPICRNPFPKQVPVCSGTGQHYRQNIILHAVSRGPTRPNTAFSVPGPIPCPRMNSVFLIGVNLLETTSRCLRTCPRHRLSCFKNCLANTALIRSGLFAVMNYFATLVRTRARLRRAWASSSSRASRFFWAKVASARALLASARALSIWSAHSKVVASK